MGHGRRESRTYVQIKAPATLPGFGAWRGLKSISVVISEVERDGKTSNEMRHFISSLPVEAEAFAHAVLSHWGVENSCHWTLDVTYREDESSMRERHLRENVAWLNRFSLSLLKQHPRRESVAMKSWGYGWSEDFMMQFIRGSIC